MRMFAALVPPIEAVEHLDTFLEVRRDSGQFRWTSSEQFHVTLGFYEHVAERHLDDFLERLQRAAGRRTPVNTAVKGGGAFPHPASARVLWAGLSLDEGGAAELDRLATGCRAAATKAGVGVDGQRFRPHVTVARIGHASEVSNWVRLLDSYAGPTWVADRVDLIASYLGEGPRKRPRYETVASFELEGDR